MPTKKTKRSRPVRDPATQKVIDEMVAALQREREKRIGPDSTFEQRRDADLSILQDVLWNAEEGDFKKSTTDAEEVEVNGKKFRRLSQISSATYFGRWGAHEVEEALYREVGVQWADHQAFGTEGGHHRAHDARHGASDRCPQCRAEQPSA